MEYPPLVGAQNIFITKSDIPFLTGIHVTSFRNGHIHKQNPPPTCTLHAEMTELFTTFGGVRLFNTSVGSVRCSSQRPTDK